MTDYMNINLDGMESFRDWLTRHNAVSLDDMLDNYSRYSKKEQEEIAKEGEIMELTNPRDEQEDSEKKEEEIE